MQQDKTMAAMAAYKAQHATAALALAQWDECVQEEVATAHSLEEIVAVHCLAPAGSTAKAKALCKWNALAEQQVAAAKTRDEVVRLFHVTPPGSTSEAAALSRLLEF